MAFTPRQQAFVDAYAGNATDAARKAGYTGNDVTMRNTARELMEKPHVIAAIKARQETRATGLIATREERQAFWTAAFRDTSENILVRLKASELLGKSEADFVERHEHKGNINIRVASPYPVTGDE